jgi:putative two-component system protein, hydrogenase maturation factor HypX/HoxX
LDILFLTTAHNSLSQRLLIELTERGHQIRVCVVKTGQDMIEAVSEAPSNLIIAPMLKTAVPEQIWSKHTCLIVHPGIKGDRGASSLDWAIMTGKKIWGVTILQAAADMDAGPIWASHTFSLPASPLAKSSLYRGRVTEAAVRGVLEAVEKFQSGSFKPEPLDYSRPDVFGSLQPNMLQRDRVIDWSQDDTAAIIRKIRAADSAPGVLSTLLGANCFLYGAHEEDHIKGPPGKALARRDGAVCVGTVDGAVWITHLKAKGDPGAHKAACHLAQKGIGCESCGDEFCSIAGVKLPATIVLGPLLRGVREAPLPIDAPCDYKTFREIVYREEGQVGYLSFDFYNGAMSTEQCHRLRDAFLHARSRPTRVIVLLGGSDFWSNGIHLNVIEASADPAEQSWLNINAIDDLIYEIVSSMSQVVIAGLRGNAGAGGAILALAADRAYAMSGVVLNPHYRSMGELYGSEYWTYLLPRRVGQEKALELTQVCKPIGTKAACEIGFLNDAFGLDAEAFEAELKRRAQLISQSSDFRSILRKKHESRLDDEQVKSLASYRSEELAKMKINFFGADRAYHEARRRFVFKGNPPPRDRQPGARKTVELAFSTEGASSMSSKVIGSPPFVGINGGGRSTSPTPDENPVHSDGELVVRLVKMLRRGMEALPFMRD